MKKIIGRLYIPVDNSYSINITTPLDKINGYEHIGNVLNRDYLAGTSCSYPIICTILTQPFKPMVKIFKNESKEIECVMVKNNKTGQTSVVMFHEWGLDVKERIQAVNESNQRNHSELPLLTI